MTFRQLQGLEKCYNEALKAKKESFIYNGQEFYTTFVKYYLEAYQSN